MRVYFLTSQTHRDYDNMEVAQMFFRWFVDDDSEVFTDLLRKFVGASVEFGGLGGTVESVDDLTPVSDLVREWMAEALIED